VEQLESTLKDGDVLVVMGAGPVWEVARDYMASSPETEAENVGDTEETDALSVAGEGRGANGSF
jgi:hypothetical protein